MSMISTCIKGTTLLAALSVALETTIQRCFSQQHMSSLVDMQLWQSVVELLTFFWECYFGSLLPAWGNFDL